MEQILSGQNFTFLPCTAPTCPPVLQVKLDRFVSRSSDLLVEAVEVLVALWDRYNLNYAFLSLLPHLVAQEGVVF